MQQETRWLYCVECPQYSIRLKALGYLCDCLSGRVQRYQVVKPLTHDPSRPPVETGRRDDGLHDGRYFLAAVLTAVKTAVKTGHVTGVPSRRPSRRLPKDNGRRDGSCVRGFKAISHKALRRRWMVQSYSPGGGHASFHNGTLAPPCEYD